MPEIYKLMTVTKTEGEVLIHCGDHGWKRAEAGMVLQCSEKVTVKTGSRGYVEIANTADGTVRVDPSSLLVVYPVGTVDRTFPEISLRMSEIRTRLTTLRPAAAVL